MAARRLHGLIYATIALCCLVIVICSVSLGTDQWFKATGTSVQSTALSIEVSYGLFKGKKKSTSEIGSLEDELKIVCVSSKCMYSCGKSGSQRKQNLEEIIAGGTVTGDTIICASGPVESRNGANQFGNFSGRQADGTTTDPVFLSFALYLITIICLCGAMIFAIVGGGLALYNTYRTPFRPILSVFGLYIWNGISASLVLLAMIIWGVAFATSLSKNAGVSNTLTGTYSTKGNGSLGISFWILPLALVFAITNMGIIRYRSYRIVEMEAKNVKVMTEKLESGDILLF